MDNRIGRSLGTDYFGIADQLTAPERDYLRRARGGYQLGAEDNCAR